MTDAVQPWREKNKETESEREGTDMQGLIGVE